MGKRILITPRSLTSGGHPALKPLEDAGYELVMAAPGRQPSEDELIAALPGCEGWLAGVEKITARVLEAADCLGVISRNGTGVDNIALAKATELGIRICRAEGANARGVAELAFGLVLALARAIPASDAAIKQGGWTRNQGIELQGRTLGIVGYGRIGKQVAQFAWAFGMNVLAYDVFTAQDYRPAGSFSYASLHEVLARADVITLHCPPADGGKPLIGSDELALVKPGTLLINTARADLIDPSAVADALAVGKLGGLATDVFTEEPPKDLALVRHDRLIATPHIGGFTAESVSRAVTVAVDNLLNNLD